MDSPGPHETQHGLFTAHLAKQYRSRTIIYCNSELGKHGLGQHNSMWEPNETIRHVTSNGLKNKTCYRDI
jgi:hypothetical protein